MALVALGAALLSLFVPAAAFGGFRSLTPPSPTDVFQALDLAVYAADRQRDELLSGVKRSLLGSDPLDSLTPWNYALDPATSTVAVTGATDGIGQEAALFLARAGYGVVLCARDAAKGERAAAAIRADARDGRIAVIPLDLASVRSVEAAAPLIVSAAASLGAPLRGLILNAGIWPGTLQTTADGMELALQTCHIGHQQLTQRLLPELRATAAGEGEAARGEARVVTVSSSAHAFATDARLEDPLWAATAFDSNRNYGRAKFANMLFAQELASRAPAGVVATAAHPGLVLTTLFKELGPSYDAGSGFSRTGRSAVDDRLAGVPRLRALQASTPLKLVLKSPAEGCRPIVYALLAPGLPRGGFVSDCELRDISPASKSAAAREELWRWTEVWLERALDEERRGEGGDGASEERTGGAAESARVGAERGPGFS